MFQLPLIEFGYIYIYIYILFFSSEMRTFQESSNTFSGFYFEMFNYSTYIFVYYCHESKIFLFMLCRHIGRVGA